MNIVNEDAGNVLLSVCDDGWSGAGNTAVLKAVGQELSGAVLVGSDSTLNMNLSSGSVFTGTVSGSITNGKGDGTFAPDGTLPWAQAMKLLLCAHGDLSDVTGDAWGIPP